MLHGNCANATLSANDAELPDPRPPAPAHSQSGGARDSDSVHWDAPYHTTPAGVARPLRSQAGAGRSRKTSRKSPRQTGESALADHFLVVPPCTVCSPPHPSLPQPTSLNFSPGACHQAKTVPLPLPWTLYSANHCEIARNKHLIISVPCSLILPWLPIIHR